MSNGKTVALLMMMTMMASLLAGCVDNVSTDDAVDAMLGCTYEDADNYDSNATVDDGSCTWSDDEGETAAAFSTEGDVECDVFTAPTVTEDAVASGIANDAVIGVLGADGYVELLVEPGFVTVIIDCIDMNGNTGFDVTTSALLSDLAGDPQYRDGSASTSATDAASMQAAQSSGGRAQGRGPDFGCWVNRLEWNFWANGITNGNSNFVGYVVDRSTTNHNQGETPPPGGWGRWVRVQPCPLSIMAQTNTNSGSSVHVTTIHLINANPGHRNNITLIGDWTSGSDDATGTIGIVIVPVHNVLVCYNRCISGWPGKVNQHIFNGTWMTDPDGASGWHNSTEYATGYFDRKLAYCQKWWPDTTIVQLRTFRETLAYYNAGNPEPPIPSTRDVYDCLVMEALDTDGDGLSDWDEVNIYNTNATNPDTDGDGISDGDEVNNGTDPLDPDCKSPTGWKNESASNREAEPDRCWRDTMELEEYTVTISREDDDVRTIRTFTRYAVWPGWHTFRVFTISTPVATWYHICPPHSGNMDDSKHWASRYGHFSIPPWSSTPSPPVHMIVVTTLSDPPGDYYGENEHLWSYEFSEDTGPNSYPAWGWVCGAGSIGEQ